MTQPAIAPANGRLGVLLPGLGAVSTTYIAGILNSRKRKVPLFGSVSELAHVRLGTRTEHRQPLIRELVPLAAMKDLEFGAWDLFPDNAYEAAKTAGVLKSEDLEPIRAELEAINPWPGAFDRDYVKKLEGVHIKTGTRSWPTSRNSRLIKAATA
jgi:myo-inositol-1-phosphate synthase